MQFILLSISLYSVFVSVRVVLKNTVGGDRGFDSLSGSSAKQ